MNILIAYATRHDSTRQVVDAIAKTLREHGHRVEVRVARSVRTPVVEWDLVVVGAPLYSGRWHRDAHRLLRRLRRELAVLPVAVFAMGPRDDTEDAWHHSYAQLDRALAKHRWLHPVTTTVFGGVDPPGHVHPRRDIRDWHDITRWATRTTDATHRAQPR